MGDIASRGARVPAGYTAYEYRNVRVKQDKEALYRDSFEHFGWSVDASDQESSMGGRTLRMRRDRDIAEKTRLLALERRCEAALEEIEALERARTTTGSVVAWVVGLVGTVLLGFSVFGMQAEIGASSLVVGVGGILLWLAAYPVFRTLRRVGTKRVAPAIERQYDEVYRTWADASRLGA